MWIFDAGLRPLYRTRQHMYGFVLPDNPLLELLLHVQKPFALLNIYPVQRDTRPF